MKTKVLEDAEVVTYVVSVCDPGDEAFSRGVLDGGTCDRDPSAPAQGVAARHRDRAHRPRRVRGVTREIRAGRSRRPRRTGALPGKCERKWWQLEDPVAGSAVGRYGSQQGRRSATR